MAYTLDFSLDLGPANGGLSDLRAQLVDTTGTNSGAAISTGFVEIAGGKYLWHHTGFPDGHRGGVKFYSNAAPAVILAFAAINPQEAENTDQKTSQVLDGALSEPGAVFGWGGATARTVLAWLGALARNKITQNATTQTLRNGADNANVATATVSDDGTTFTRGEWS